MHVLFLLSAACFLLAFLGLAVRADPRRWRRIYQAVFEQSRVKNINRNKSIDEAIPAPALRISVTLLFFALLLALTGLSGANLLRGREAEAQAALKEGPSLDVLHVPAALRLPELAPDPGPGPGPGSGPASSAIPGAAGFLESGSEAVGVARADVGGAVKAEGVQSRPAVSVRTQDLTDAERELLKRYGLAPEDEEGDNEADEADEADEAAGDSQVEHVPVPGSSTGMVPEGASPDVIAALAEQAFLANDFVRAEQLYERLAETARTPDRYGMVLANIGVVRMRLKKFRAAQQVLVAAQEIHPDDAFVSFMLGMSHYWQGQNYDAVLALEHASGLDPDNVKTHYYTAIASTRLGDFSRAEKGFLDAVALDPDFAPAHFNLAVIYASGYGGGNVVARAEQHYFKAVGAGAEPDLVLEQFLNASKVIVHQTGG